MNNNNNDKMVSKASSTTKSQQKNSSRVVSAPKEPVPESPVAPQGNSDTSIDDNACVVCFKNVEIYSIGDCDHPVCYECSTRMRVLCEQNECPICRHEMSKVVFTHEKLKYRQLETSNRSDFYSKKYRIGFCSAEIQQKFFQLLDHPCPKCSAPPYRTFHGLRDHVRREHGLLYCDLCVDSLKIFTFERRCYTVAELHIHNAKGDADNRSHRGHPLCEYCNKRFLDRDELFRHLRREHFYCHICDADGCNEFYNKYPDLANHFRQDHFLCEEGHCAEERFIAFRNEIEFKAHVAKVHGKNLSKQQVKQARTLQLEITLGPRGRNGQTEKNIATMRSRNEEGLNYMEEAPTTSAHRGHSVTIDADNVSEFPLLAGAAVGPNVSLVRPPPPSMRNLSGSSGLARTKENFPALGGGGGGGGGVGNYNNATVKSSQPTQSVAGVIKKVPGSSASGGPVARVSAPANGMLLHVSNRPAANGNGGGTSNKKSTVMDFPALPATKGKKGMTIRDLEEDMLPSNSGIAGMSKIATKHRALVDDYVSIANPSTYQKLQMVQKEEQEAKARLEELKKSAPKLTATDFPTLKPSAARATTKSPNTAVAGMNWAKPMSEKKQRDMENRKAKVAPAPVLMISKTSNVNVNKASNNNNSEQQTNSKKDKKSKDKKNNQETQGKMNGSKPGKEKNNNSNTKSNDQKESTASDSVKNVGSMSPTTKRAPPGFTLNTSLKPPPGFISDVTLNSVVKLPSDLTFTNSLGESYSIVPSSHTFSDPPDATVRNQKLVNQFRDILKTQEALNDFRLLSLQFRNGSCSGQAYYDHCQNALKNHFYKVFPELLVMLPDISKQQELYLVHKQHVNTMTPTQRSPMPNLEVCSTCKQILVASDFSSHQQTHQPTGNFQNLGSSTISNN